MDTTIRKRHPILGFFAGLLLGLGATLLLVSYAIVPFDEITPWVVLGICVVLGVVVGMVGPARRKAT